MVFGCGKVEIEGADAGLAEADVENAVVEFLGCTKTRNFFCHAAYSTDDQARLSAAHSASLSDNGEPLIRDNSRLLDRSALNDIVETARRLADLNPVLWGLVRRLEDALQVPPERRQQTTFTEASS